MKQPNRCPWLEVPARAAALGGLVFALVMAPATWAATSSAESNITMVDTRAAATGTLTGLVQAGGAPVANAQARIDGTGFAASTGTDGRFTLASVPAGSGYLLKVSAAGYASKPVPGVTVTSGTTDLGTIQLSALSGPYRLVPLQPDVNPPVTQIEDGGVGYRYYRVLSSDGKTPAGGVTVSLRLAGGASIPQDGGPLDDWSGYGESYWPGFHAGTADGDGTVRLRLPASAIGGPGAGATLEVVESGTVKQTFTARVLPGQFDQVWRQKLGAGLSVGQFLTAGVDAAAESEVRQTLAGGVLAGETISRDRIVDGTVGVGVDVGSSLTVSSASYSFAAGGEASAGANAFVAIGLGSTFAFDPDSTDAAQNAMKLYVDLGNVLSGVPGPPAAFYDFVERTIEPAFLGSHLQSLEGDLQIGAGVQGQVVFGSGIAAPMAVNFQADASAGMEGIFGGEVTLGSDPQIATVKGVAASGSALASGSASLGVGSVASLTLGGASFAWETSADVEMLRKDWTRKGQGGSYRTEWVRKLGLGAGQQNPVSTWQKYDPQALFASYQREFTETVEQMNGSSLANYDWSVYAGQQQLGANLNVNLGIGVSLQGELDQGAEIVNERGAVSQSRYWPTESYPALTSAQFPTRSWTSLLSQWGTYAVGPIGQALNAFASEVANGVDTVIHAGSSAVLRIGQGAMAAGSWVVTRFVPGWAGGGPLMANYGPRGHQPKDGGTATNLVYGVGGIYRFESTNSFNGTGTLSIAYSPAGVAGLNPTDLRIYYLPDGTNRWQLVGGTVNAASNTVTATISQLGTYTLAPPLPTGGLQLTPSTNTLAADGASQMTVVVTNIFLNTGNVATQQWAFTATAVGVSILNPDADTNAPGVQVLSSNGAVTLFLRAPVGGTVARVSLASAVGDAFGSTAINLLDNAPPATPTGVSVTAGQSRGWVSWRTNREPDLAGYRVYYRMGLSGPPWDGTAAVEGTPSPVMVTGTNCLLRGLTLGTNYFVAVSAVDTTGNESPLSAAIQVATTPGAPLPPTSVTVRFGADGTNILMWALSEDDGYNDRDVARYEVWRAVLPGGSYAKVGEVAAGIGLFSEPDVALSPGQYVSYAVTAVASSGASSSPALALSLIATPTLTVPAVLADGSVQLNLSGIAGLSYTVQASTNLVDWVPIQSFISTNGTMTVVDPAATNFNYRFYRAVTP